jgi:hypothetical protein
LNDGKQPEKAVEYFKKALLLTENQIVHQNLIKAEKQMMVVEK